MSLWVHVLTSSSSCCATAHESISIRTDAFKDVFKKLFQLNPVTLAHTTEVKVRLLTHSTWKCSHSTSWFCARTKDMLLDLEDQDDVQCLSRMNPDSFDTIEWMLVAPLYYLGLVFRLPVSSRRLSQRVSSLLHEQYISPFKKDQTPYQLLVPLDPMSCHEDPWIVPDASLDAVVVYEEDPAWSELFEWSSSSSQINQSAVVSTWCSFRSLETPTEFDVVHCQRSFACTSTCSSSIGYISEQLSCKWTPLYEPSSSSSPFFNDTELDIALFFLYTKQACFIPESSVHRFFPQFRLPSTYFQAFEEACVRLQIRANGEYASVPLQCQRTSCQVSPAQCTFAILACSLLHVKNKQTTIAEYIHQVSTTLYPRFQLLKQKCLEQKESLAFFQFHWLQSSAHKLVRLQTTISPLPDLECMKQTLQAVEWEMELKQLCCQGIGDFSVNIGAFPRLLQEFLATRKQCIKYLDSCPLSNISLTVSLQQQLKASHSKLCFFFPYLICFPFSSVLSSSSITALSIKQLTFIGTPTLTYSVSYLDGTESLQSFPLKSNEAHPILSHPLMFVALTDYFDSLTHCSELEKSLFKQQLESILQRMYLV